MANANVPDTSQKLTLDAKQELTVDPRVMGLGSTDEMSIKSIAQRESFLTQFSWAVADSAETLLWNTEVSPVLWNEFDEEIHMPACCFATLPFRRWRGTMKFRFQVVASAFHKGRMKITYDPSYPLTNEYNTNYTYIIDLAKERDFTVAVGWGHEKSMVNHRSPGLDPEPYRTTPLGADPLNFANGILSVFVVNDLTVPNSTVNNDIEINVFVSAGDDFEVFDPDSREIEDLVWFRPQVGEIFSPQMAELTNQNVPDADLTKQEDEPMKLDPSTTLAKPLSDHDHTSCVYYGDPITSFRQCLKRYNYHSAIASQGAILNKTLMNLRNSNFPYYRGYAPGAVHETIVPAPATPYNYCKMTLLNYVTPAFCGRRGGLRWKYLRTGCNNNTNSQLMAVTRIARPTGGYAQFENTLITQGGGTQYDRVRQNAVIVPHTWDGAVVTSTQQNPVIEAEIPFYLNTRFAPAKQGDLTSTADGFRLYHWLTTVWDAYGTDSAAIHSYVSVGEDFTLGFFTGSPIAYRIAIDPAST
jgi:hypothetical protein